MDDIYKNVRMHPYGQKALQERRYQNSKQIKNLLDNKRRNAGNQVVDEFGYWAAACRSIRPRGCTAITGHAAIRGPCRRSVRIRLGVKIVNIEFLASSRKTYGSRAISTNGQTAIGKH